MEFNADKPGTVYFDESTDSISKIFIGVKGSYYVLEIDGKIAGGCGYFPTEALPEGTCELVKMYLDKKYRGQGFGQMLLQQCFEAAKEDGYKEMYIETMPELKNAIALYIKNGFNFIEKPLGNSGHTGCDIWMIRKI